MTQLKKESVSLKLSRNYPNEKQGEKLQKVPKNYEAATKGIY